MIAVAACGGKPVAAPQACTKLEPIAKLMEAQLADEAHSPYHAFEKTEDLGLRPRNLVLVDGPLGDPSQGDYIAISATTAKAASAAGKVATVMLPLSRGGWPVTAKSVVIAPTPDAAWQSIADALAYARDNHYEAVSIAYRTEHALKGKPVPPPVADKAAWLTAMGAELRAHCPAMAELVTVEPEARLRFAAQHVRACTCAVDADKLASILWISYRPVVTLARVGPVGSQPPIAPKEHATWADVTGANTIPLALPAPK